jgi:hypothetical protein
MAGLILPLFNPVLDASKLRDDDKVIQFKEAKQTSAILPGGLHYFYFDKPRLPIQTLEVRKKISEYGRDCIVSSAPNYFRIHVDPHGDIHSLTYIGNAAIPVDNIACLYMMNEKTLNRFVARFDETPFDIPSLLSFFSDDWALFLFHDRFKNFFGSLNADMMASSDPAFRALVHKMNKLSGKGVKVINESDRVVMYDYFDSLPIRKSWDKKVFDYILECMVYDSFP